MKMFNLDRLWQTLGMDSFADTTHNHLCDYLSKRGINKCIKYQLFWQTIDMYIANIHEQSRHCNEHTHERVEQQNGVQTQVLPISSHQRLEQSFVVPQNEPQGSNRQQKVEQEPMKHQVHQEDNYRQ